MAFVFCACVATPDYRAEQKAAHADAATAEFNQDIAMLAGAAGATSGDYHIGPEDLLEITLYDIEDQQGQPRVVSARVSNSGFITLPLIGAVSARGLSPLGLEKALSAEYARFIHEPQVAVFVEEYRSYRVAVVGYVENPGVLELKGRKTLLEAIALAGGLNQEAGRSVRLARQIGADTESVLIDLEQLTSAGEANLNLALLPGDVINVPRAGIFYVEGVVRKPGAYPLLTETTVSQAIATAGGLDTAVAKSGAVTLFRKAEGGEREAIPVRIAAIRSGKAEDFVVVADDVIVVPLSGPKFFIDRLTGLLRVGVNSQF